MCFNEHACLEDKRPATNRYAEVAGGDEDRVRPEALFGQSKLSILQVLKPQGTFRHHDAPQWHSSRWQMSSPTLKFPDAQLHHHNQVIIFVCLFCFWFAIH